MKKYDVHLIHPEDQNNLHYWTKKWGVSIRELNDAILYTGSLNTTKVKTYLRKDSWFYHPVRGLRTIFKTTANFLF
jgi:hypothetical protein